MSHPSFTALQPHLHTTAYRALAELERARRVVAHADPSGLVLWILWALVTSTTDKPPESEEEDKLFSKELTPPSRGHTASRVFVKAEARRSRTDTECLMHRCGAQFQIPATRIHDCITCFFLREPLPHVD